MRTKLIVSLIGGIVTTVLLLRDVIFSVDHPVLLVVLAFVCLPAFDVWAWALFGSGTNAFRASRWLFIRDSRSLVRGDYTEDKFSEVRLGVLLGLYLVTVAAVYTGLLSIYHRVFAAGP